VVVGLEEGGYGNIDLLETNAAGLSPMCLLSKPEGRSWCPWRRRNMKVLPEFGGAAWASGVVLRPWGHWNWWYRGGGYLWHWNWWYIG
jgi:hypothetical protein